MKRPVSIRRSMMINLMLVIILLSSAILLITFIGSRGAVRELSTVVLTEMLDHTESRLREFFDPVKNEIKLAWTWGKAGVINLDNPKGINRHLIPLMLQHRQIGSLMVADENGREHMILRVGEKWTNRQTRPRESSTESLTWQWDDIRDEPKIIDWQDIKYDPRIRPWYTNAINLKEPQSKTMLGMLDEIPIAWTRPYEFFTTHDPGITASVCYTDEQGVKHVIGFDVLLKDISKFTTDLRIMDRGVVVVIDLDHEGLIVGLPHHDKFLTDEGRKAALTPLHRARDLGIPLAADAANAFTSDSSQPEDDPNYAPRQFKSGGETWWGAAREFDLGPDRELLIAVIVPHADLLGNLPIQRIWIIAITLVVFFGALWRAVVLARSYAQPVEALEKQSEQIMLGNLEYRVQMNSTIKEVNELAETQEQMRLSLQELFKLESDLKLARQIQQNTFPRRLPAIQGFEIDVWSEPADETGGDTYDVIGYNATSNGEPVIIDEEKADHAVMLLADATGHGIGPALSVTQVRAMLRMAVRMKGDLRSIASNLNEQLCADLPAGRFITAWLGELDATTQTLRSFSAGQGPILRYDAANNSVDIYNADEPPFGITGQLPINISEPVPFKPGDILAVISDGVFEGMDETSSQFGISRVVEILNKNKSKSASDILAAIRHELDRFTNGMAANDDRTAMIVKRV